MYIASTCGRCTRSEAGGGHLQLSRRGDGVGGIGFHDGKAAMLIMKFFLGSRALVLSQQDLVPRIHEGA